MASTQRSSWAFLLALAALFILPGSGCGSPDPIVQNEQEIRTAIAQYLRERRSLNPDSMQMELVQLQVDGDRAQAQVEFRSQEMQEGMRFEYTLSRVDGSWEVDGSSARDGHGGEARTLPDGHPQVAPGPAPAPPTGDS